MLKSFKLAALAAVVGVTGLVTSTPSIAQDVEFLIGPDGVRVRTAEYCDTRRGRDDYRCRDYQEVQDRRDRRDRRDDYRDDRRDRRGDDRYERRRCEPEQAVDAARRYGVRRARVVDVGRRSIKVAGVGERGRVIYTFGRDRGCPLIDRERVRDRY